MSKTLKTSGIILKSSPIFEKDKRIEIFSGDYGRLNVLAKGAQSRPMRFGGSLEPLVLTEMVLYKGTTFLLLNHASIIDCFDAIRSDFNKIGMGAYFGQIIKNATSIDQHNRALFKLLRLGLEWIAAASSIDLPRIKDRFHYEFLRLEGLISDDVNEVSDEVFRAQFENYANCRISPPIRLIG